MLVIFISFVSFYLALKGSSDAHLPQVVMIL